MNTNSHNHNAMNSTPNSDSGRDCGEDTLRLIASLPAPAGLEERVHKALGAAPRSHVLGSGRVLAWPARFRTRIASGTALENNWMRAVAAAAIVFVVVGGGWGVYSRVQPGPAGKVIVMPQLVPSSGGGISGAIRTPLTIPGPKVRDQGTEGTRDRGTQAEKKVVAPKKRGASPAASQVTPAPQPAVSQ
jgi:hypothetical protein